MCKHCKFTYVDDHERRNDLKPVVSIRNGSYVSEVYIHRYHCDDGSSNELELEESVILNDGLHLVTSKCIKIRYCPFCGEKL
jgi:hypothetical protein